ncbi:DUF4430 domain-containing protein [Aquibacillus kalidii]|uniref:DUF4430 domain-containing protein n=1 Tax=Aquibacillus kalidii TaxID=2762597 RepID=UPI001645A2DD|nr:DUF4430 domain-containing protein [Aquibacillus kalidii]
MKRVLISMIMLTLFLVVGCAKDQVVEPGSEAAQKLSGELTAHDVTMEHKTYERKKIEEELESTEEDKSENKSTSTENEKEESISNQPNEQVNTNTEAPKISVEENKENNEKSKENKATTSENKEQPSTTKQDQPKEPTKPKQTVTITIVAPGTNNETILPTTTVEMNDGDTVLDITQKIVKAKEIQMSVSGANATAYVKSIGNIEEMQYGAFSGWEVFVDGQGIDRSTGVYGVKAGQAIKWRYTKNYME